MNPVVPVERFLGCLLGQAVGDGLGAPYEGLPADHIYWTFGPASGLVESPREATLRYTDDTRMMIGVAETLADRGEIVEEALCAAFAAHYDPDRGYGPGARKILQALRDGDDWRTLAETVFPGGSLGNGAAMRAAPIGLLFGDDLDRVVEQAERSARPTHRHPLGIEGAQLLALAAAVASRQPSFDRKGFYRELIGRCRSEEFAWQLEAASKLRRRHTFGFLGNSLEAHRSVVAAIACFTTCPGSYEQAVARAIALGDDTDTLAAMAGALAGAHLGIAAIPGHLIDRLEDGPAGRGYLESLALRLHAQYERA
jgi:poly(ADP-ribose) glycohydrolase ARH3